MVTVRRRKNATIQPKQKRTHSRPCHDHVVEGFHKGPFRKSSNETGDSKHDYHEW